MSEECRLRGPLDKQHGKRSQALLKSASEHLYHIHWSLTMKLSWKRSLWSTCEIFVLFVNTLAVDEKYPVLKRDNLTIPIHMQLSQKQKTFSWFIAAFLKSRLNFEHFEKKDDTQSFCISEFADSENVVRYIVKQCRFRLPFDKQHGKRSQALIKSASQHLFHIDQPLPRQLSWKKFLLLTCKILGLLFNTLRADGKYPVLNRDNLTIPIQKQWSQK